jgi:hypothetical protein
MSEASKTLVYLWSILAVFQEVLRENHTLEGLSYKNGNLYKILYQDTEAEKHEYKRKWKVSKPQPLNVFYGIHKTFGLKEYVLQSGKMYAVIIRSDGLFEVIKRTSFSTKTISCALQSYLDKK